MGRSLRSKIARRNRARLREEYAPKELEKLKATLAFEYNEQTEKAHLSMFHDLMNGPPPELPGLEPGSNIAKLHLTDTNTEADLADEKRVAFLSKRFVKAERALRFRPYGPPEDEVEEKIDDKEPKLFNGKTMRDQFGQYPPWMHRKEIIRRARIHRLEKAKATRLKKKGVLKRGPTIREMRNTIMDIDNDDNMPEYSEIKKVALKGKTKDIMRAMYK